MRKRIVITTGDPAGVGPGILRDALASGQLDNTAEYIVLGSSDGHEAGKPTPASAREALRALEESVQLVRRGDADAIVTCPVSKAAMTAIGFPFPGHTEFFGHHFGVPNPTMILTGQTLTVALATIHIPVREIPALLTADAIVHAGIDLAAFLQKILSSEHPPRIAVAGLNPHAGEAGTIGTEEIEIIQPAIRQLQEHLSDSVKIRGPFSPDTLFFQAAQGEWDAVLCMYHDQGLIPLKLLDFHTGVNVTWGLPFPRTSPDHGTAFDLASSGTANPRSLIEAIQLAVRLCAS